MRAENLAKILPNAKEARRAFKKAIKQHDHNGSDCLPGCFGLVLHRASLTAVDVVALLVGSLKGWHVGG